MTEHPLVREYLSTFDRAATVLPPQRRAVLRQEIAAHLRDSIPADLPDGAAAMVIADFGTAEEIVAQEPLGGAQRNWRQFVLPGILAAVVVAALIAAVALRPEPITSAVNAYPEGPDRVTTGVAYAEYKAETAVLDPLPPGAEYPIGVPRGLDAGPVDPAVGVESGVMEAGAGRWTARFTWLCAWELEYLAAFEAGAMDRRVAAEAALDSFAEADYLPGWGEAVLGAMHFGDDSKVKADAPLTCEQAQIVHVLR